MSQNTTSAVQSPTSLMEAIGRVLAQVGIDVETARKRKRNVKREEALSRLPALFSALALSLDQLARARQLVLIDPRAGVLDVLRAISNYLALNASNGNSRLLYDILSALRGPDADPAASYTFVDDPVYRLKDKGTAVIRGTALPGIGPYAHVDRSINRDVTGLHRSELLSLRRAEFTKEAYAAVALSRFSLAHFRNHVDSAYSALIQLWQEHEEREAYEEAKRRNAEGVIPSPAPGEASR